LRVSNLDVGAERLTIIGGPCLAESPSICRTVGEALKTICEDLGFQYIFKASFDKANRTSASSQRGDGLDVGLQTIVETAQSVGAPCTTDVHDPSQVARIAESVDLLQVPAFLCRQSDLLEACARSGRPVNVKKGQFLAPWDAQNIVEKLRTYGASGIMLTERGTSFGYNTLIVDMPGLEIMRSFGVPVCFDATHSAQRPGGAGTATGGNRESIPALARAAVAVGIDAVFLEVHPDPDRALSDSATQWPLSRARELLTSIKLIYDARSQIG
jgi:2-dehydro-3-deoxyphosphooctonate aldolase (KDO 8-P synthase)